MLCIRRKRTRACMALWVEIDLTRMTQVKSARNATKRLETWRVLESFYKSGRCRAIGVSNYEQQHLQELLDTAAVKPMVNQVSPPSVHIPLEHSSAPERPSTLSSHHTSGSGLLGTVVCVANLESHSLSHNKHSCSDVLGCCADRGAPEVPSEGPARVLQAAQRCRGGVRQFGLRRSAQPQHCSADSAGLRADTRAGEDLRKQHISDERGYMLLLVSGGPPSRAYLYTFWRSGKSVGCGREAYGWECSSLSMGLTGLSCFRQLVLLAYS